MRSSKIRRIDSLDGLEVLRTRFDKRRFPNHCHSTFVVQLVEVGVDWCCVNDLDARVDEVWLHEPDAAHSGGTRDGHVLQYSAIYPAPSLVARLLRVAEADLPRGSSYVLRDERSVQLLRSFFYQDTESSAEARISELFDHVLADPRAANARQETGDAKRRIDEARQYLRTHATRNVSLAELGTVCGLSRYHLIREFRKHAGITPHQFLISARVDCAKAHMRNGATLIDAALAAGFADQSHMTRCFGRVLGYSPGALARA